MKKYVFVVFWVAVIATWAARSQSGEILSQAVNTTPLESAPLVLAKVNDPDLGSPLSTHASFNTPEAQPNPDQKPDIPLIVDELYLGVPAGNGHRPHQVAVDNRHRRVYTLNYGETALRQGNTISAMDLKTGQITALIRLDNMGPEDFSPPDPLALQIDPYRPRLYAVWGDRYAEVPESWLTIIDTASLTIVGTLPGVEAIAVGPDRLYLANDTRLWAVDPDSLAEIKARELDPRKFNEPLLLNPHAGRVYMGRGRPWSLETFDADTLTPITSYPMLDRLVGGVTETDGERLFILENDGKQIVLRALSADGYGLADPAPVPLTDNAYSDLPLAFDGQTLYIAGGDYGNYRLDAYSLPNLRHLDSLPLANKPYDLSIDPTTGLLYAAYSNWSSYVLVIDPAGGPAQPIYTALTINDALADPGTGYLYALDDSGTLRVLSLADYQEITHLETGFNKLSGFSTGYGQLSLDPSRDRLYIGGDPVQIVDTNSLRVTAHLDGRGQVTADPTSDRLYLTPPCNCRLEQCNTLILNTETLTGTQALFPPEDPFTAPCVVTTHLDAENQLLYAQIYNGTPGSNSGDYYTVFDVSGQPEELYTAFDISYGEVALDPLRQRAFAPRYRINRSFIHRFEAQGGTITQTMALVGAHGQLAYDPLHDRLYAVQRETLQVFDGDLALLAESSLPGEFDLLAFDAEGRRLYLGGPDGNVLVVASNGGQLEPPPPPAPSTDQPQIQQLLTAPDGTLFRVYNMRLYRSQDGGQNWILLGRGLPGRPVGDVAISPAYEEDHTMLAGLWDFGFGGGLYRSTDGGDTWQPTTRGLSDLEITGILFSPGYTYDQTVFLTTIDHGLFRSTDGGDTWSSLAQGYAENQYDLDIVDLALSPAFADDKLVIISKNHLLRSIDGGDSWEDTGIPGGLLAFSPNFSKDELILSSGNWRSTDKGQTWQPAAVGREPGAAEGLLFSHTFADDQSVYLVLRQSYEPRLKLQRSLDAGQSWESLMDGLPAGFEIASATILPSGELYLTALDGRTLIISAGELVWGRAPVDITQLELQALAITPDGTLFVANSEAGVFKSEDGGHTWAEADFPARAQHVLQPAQLTVADDGTLFVAIGTVIARSTDDGRSWTHLESLPPGFEIASLAVSPDFAADNLVLIGGDYRNNQILRSADGGDSWEMVLDGAALNIEYASDISALAFSPNFARDETLYAWLQDGGLLRSTDGGLSWGLEAESKYYGQTLALSPSGDRLYLGALYGHTLVSEDGGQNWLDLRDKIPDERSWSTALAFGPDGALLLGTDKGAYRSPDEGQTWYQASAGLPLREEDRTPQAVRALRFHDARVYAALVQGGLFVSDDLGDSWRSTITGQPASPIEKLSTPTPGRQLSSQPARQTPTPQADCPAPPDHYEALWADRVAELGCPVAAYSLPMVEQGFEGGWMFWRSDLRVIYVLPAAQPYTRFDDTWDESQPAYSCPDRFISQTPPTPHRGFGKVWCNQPQVRQLLGGANSQERLFDAILQEFDAGLIFETDQGATYILESRLNGWERVE